VIGEAQWELELRRRLVVHVRSRAKVRR